MSHRIHRAALALTIACLSAGAAPVQEKNSETESEKAAVEWTLESLFDEDATLFGPSARSMAFSADGKYAAYLWRPLEERRHGNDIWLFDVEKGTSTRLTSVSVMEPFQKSARKVAEDRLKKAKKGSKKKNDSDEGEEEGDKETKKGEKRSWSELREKAQEGETDDGAKDTDRSKLIDTVGEGDADDDDAPRYRGISGFVWAPEGHEMLISSGGDIYRYAVGSDDGEGELKRLTKTRESEREVQYLPDGSGYTSLAGGALLRVDFGDHYLTQLDPPLPNGMSMRQYALSPDGKRLVFIASSSSGAGGNRRTVDIATYRDRFMKVRTVGRTVSDDPIAKTKSAVFLYELPERDAENGRLIKVYERESSGPRDVLELPDWAPDSSRVAFAVFDQKSSQVHIMQADFEKDEENEDSKGEEKSKGNNSSGDDDAFETKDARVVYRFLHTGGPNTPRMIDPRYLSDSRRLALLTEQTGFRHVHLLDPVYETLEPVTRGRYEVYPRAMSKDRSTLFVEATKEDSANLDLYALDFETEELTRLSNQRGQHSSGAVSDDGQHVLAIRTAYGAPRELVHIDVAEGTTEPITDSHPERTQELVSKAPTFFSYENRDGQEIKGFLFEPEEEAKEGEKRPLLLYVYGGPLGTRKQVVEGNTSSASYMFAQYMTREHGWVTATIDPRGMSGYGALFEKANFERVGKPQVDDLVDGVKHLIENYGVDPERVAMHGWSFGGFQTQMCLYTEPDVFTCGIAGAGPTEWENYNSWYSTGTIGDSREGKTDLKKYSLLPLAKNLQSKLLLVHGMEDSNVLYQDTVRVYAELLEAGKETLVELFVDPTGGHGLGGLVKSLNRYRKYEEFLLRANQPRERESEEEASE